MIDFNAPIIPYEGLGGLKFYTHIRDLQDIVLKLKEGSFVETEFKSSIIDYSIIFDKKGVISLIFNIINGKLYAIEVYENYKGKLFGSIHVGMHIDEVLKLEPGFIYEDFEEIYISDKGIVIETDVITHCVSSIGISIKERKFGRVRGDSFDRGEW